VRCKGSELFAPVAAVAADAVHEQYEGPVAGQIQCQSGSAGNEVQQAHGVSFKGREGLADARIVGHRRGGTGGRDHKRNQLVARYRHAHRLGGLLVLAQRTQAMAEA
jgi:hypothetical protein